MEATLDESAEQVEGGLSIDSYTSTYSAQYQMARRGGVWKIVGAKVIYR